MGRAILYAIKITIFLVIAYWLIENPGQVTLDWQGYLVEMSTPLAVLLLIAVMGAAAVLYHGYRLVLESPRLFGQMSASRRRGRGYEALTKGLSAVAAGDAPLANKLAKKARELLKGYPLTDLLSAQAAQLSGDNEAAAKIYRRMLNQPELAFFGVRGLLTHLLKTDGRTIGNGQVNREALTLARRAFELESKSPWVVETLFDLEMLAGEYERAIGLIDHKVRLNLLDKTGARRRRAAILLARADDAVRHERMSDARSYANRATKLAPDFAPAAIKAAELMRDAGKLRQARSTLTRAWHIIPHPSIATAWDKLCPYGDAEGHVRWMRRLCDQDEREDHLALGQILLRAHHWEEAREEISKALQVGSDSRALRLMADLEMKEKNDTVAAANWLALAAEAPPPPAWVSTETGYIQSTWTPFSMDTGQFDVLEWLIPAPAGAAKKAVRPEAHHDPNWHPIEADFSDVEALLEDKSAASDARSSSGGDRGGAVVTVDARSDEQRPA